MSIEQFFTHIVDIFQSGAVSQPFYLGAFLQKVGATLLAGFLLMLYYRFRSQDRGRHNTGKFSLTLLPLSLMSMFMLSVVSSSLSLAVGLVGTLSIVRYRAQINSVEMLVFLFLAIALGLAMGTGQFIVGFLGLVLIPAIMELKRWLGGKRESILQLKITCESNKTGLILDLLKARLDFFELESQETNSKNTQTFLRIHELRPEGMSLLSAEIRNIDSEAAVSFESRDS